MADLKQHKLGWIGIGRMGYAMAARLARAGCDLAVWNRTRAKAEPLKEHGVRVVDRLTDLASCDVVFTMVSTGRHPPPRWRPKASSYSRRRYRATPK